MKDLLNEYVALYGKETWSMSTYSSNIAMINNYILPIIGDDKLTEINTRFIERYYQWLLRTPAVVNPATGKRASEYVSTGTLRDIHKLLRNCFHQAVQGVFRILPFWVLLNQYIYIDLAVQKEYNGYEITDNRYW